MLSLLQLSNRIFIMLNKNKAFVGKQEFEKTYTNNYV